MSVVDTSAAAGVAANMVVSSFPRRHSKLALLYAGSSSAGGGLVGSSGNGIVPAISQLQRLSKSRSVATYGEEANRGADLGLGVGPNRLS